MISGVWKRPFGALNAFAQGGAADSGYKALVCVFLFGGNDANNTLVPFDSVGYGNYARLRGPLALPQSQLLQLASLPNYGLHSSLPEIRQLIEFSSLNLTRPSYPKDRFHNFDMILCENVTIYFQTEVTCRVIDSLYETLQPGGWRATIRAFHRW